MNFLKKILGIKSLSTERSETPKQHPMTANDLFQKGVNYRENGSWVLAADYTRQAAVLNHAEAQFNYALMCMRGDGVTRSDSEGLRWMKKSADNGFVPAIKNVEILKMTGHIK